MKSRLSKIAILYWFAIILASVYRAVYAFVMHKSILHELNPLGIVINALFLHGFAPDNTINNAIVRGGWFVGAIVIIYSLFPVLYRIYFHKKKFWEKSRIYLFPLVVFVVSSLIYWVLKNYPLANSFNKFLLQLAPFSLGFPLYELQTTSINRIKHPLCKGVIWAVLGGVLYFVKTPITPFYVFFIGLAFFYIISYVLGKENLHLPIANSESLLVKLFIAIGNCSYPIYLTHSYIAFDFCYVVTILLSRLYPSHLLWFVALQLPVIVLSYFVGKYFDLIVNFIVSKFKWTK